jgi:prophage antirepressor-like protein
MHNEPSANSGHGTPLPLNHIHTLSYRDATIRLAVIDGRPWFVAADVCKALGVYNPRHGAAKCVRALADTQKALCRLPDVLRGSPAVLLVSESGLDKLLWLALHSVTEAWSVLSSINGEAISILAQEARNC